MSQKIRIKLKSYDHKLPSHTQAYLHREPFYLR